MRGHLDALGRDGALRQQCARVAHHAVEAAAAEGALELAGNLEQAAAKQAR